MKILVGPNGWEVSQKGGQNVAHRRHAGWHLGTERGDFVFEEFDRPFEAGSNRSAERLRRLSRFPAPPQERTVGRLFEKPFIDERIEHFVTRRLLEVP